MNNHGWSHVSYLKRCSTSQTSHLFWATIIYYDNWLTDHDLSWTTIIYYDNWLTDHDLSWTTTIYYDNGQTILNMYTIYYNYWLAIITDNKQFCYILAPRFDSSPGLEVFCSLSAFWNTFNFENWITNKHFTGTFVYIKMLLCARLTSAESAYNNSYHH